MTSAASATFNSPLLPRAASSCINLAAPWEVAWGRIFSHESPVPPTGRVSLTPERSLFAAILEQAIDHLVKFRHARTEAKLELYREAEAWFAAEDATHPCSFVSVCGALGIEPGYIRRGLAAMAGPVRGSYTRKRRDRREKMREYRQRVKIASLKGRDDSAESIA